MKQTFALISVLFVALVVSACTNLVSIEEQPGVISGTVAYRERIALPEDARITVKLVDISKQDVAAEVISQHAFLAGKQSLPYSFNLSYFKNDINPNHTYAVQARIEVDNQLMFITDTTYQVLHDAQQPLLDLILVKVN